MKLNIGYEMNDDEYRAKLKEHGADPEGVSQAAIKLGAGVMSDLVMAGLYGYTAEEQAAFVLLNAKAADILIKVANRTKKEAE